MPEVLDPSAATATPHTAISAPTAPSPGELSPEAKRGFARFTERMTKKHVPAVLTDIKGIAPQPQPPVAVPAVATEPAATPPPEPEAPKHVEAPKGPKRGKKPDATVSAPVPNLTADDLAEAVARGTATAMQSRTPAATASEPTIVLSDEEKRKASIFDKMAELHPNAKGLRDKYVASLERQTSYEQKWLDDHPGEEFVADATEHDEFFNRNTIDYDPDQYTEAIAEIRFEQRAKPLKDEVDSIKSERERERQVQQLEPELVRQQRAAGAEFFDQLGDEDFKASDLIGKDLTVNTAHVDKLIKSNEFKAGTYLAAAQRTEAVARAAHTVLNGIVQFNAENAVHLELDAAVDAIQKEVQALPPSQQLNSGKQFKKWSDFHKLPAKERDRFWTVTAADASRFVAAKNAAEARNTYEKEVSRAEKIAQSLGYSKNGSPQSAKTATTVPSATPSQQTVKPVSPAATSPSVSTVEGGAQDGTKLSGFNRFARKMSGGKL